MRYAAFLLVVAVALAPAGAQIQIPSAPPSSVALTALEKDIDGRITTTGGADPCVVLGGTRGLYVTGFGAVFTSDVDLVNSPSIGLFQTTISPEQKALVHKRKLAHVTLLQSTMRDMVTALAQSASLKSMSGTDQIVVGVRLMYRPWEDTSGLPGQIVMRADRQGGNIRTELQ